MPEYVPVRFGHYRLDPAQGLRRGKQEIRLTPKALSVLCVLAARSGEVVTKEDLFRLAWPGTAVSDAALTSCIQELRRALRDDAREPRYIETVHRRGYRFVAARATASAAHDAWADSPRPVPVLFGREAELEGLRQLLARTRRGHRQVVFLSGEPGIGKTTLVDAFLAEAAADPGLRITRGQCVERYGAGEAYQPLLEAFTRLALGPAGEAVVATLGRCAPTWLAQMPALLAPAAVAALQRRTAGVTRERMLRELSDAVEALAREAPVVLWLEDLHWSDVPTLDWIASFAQRPERAAVMVLGTYRPAQQLPVGHPLRSVTHELRVHGACLETGLGRLIERDVLDLVGARFPAAPQSEEAMRELAAELHRHTEGNPLFVAAVLGDLVARDLLVQREGAWTPRAGALPLAIPEDVRRLVERQLEDLPPAARGLIEVAAVAGTVFPAAAVAAGAAIAVGDAEAVLGDMSRHLRLVRAAGAEEWPDGTVSGRFAFLHAVYREVAYDHIPASRRVALHRAVGARAEAGYGPRAGEIAAELAMHFEKGREIPRAAGYLQQASAAAARRGAYAEALVQVERGLALLEALPRESGRDDREAALRIAQGGLLMALRGWGGAGVEEAYAHARELCRGRDGAPHMFPALWGSWLLDWGRGRLVSAAEAADQLLVLAHDSPDSGIRLQAHHAQWATALVTGQSEEAEAQASQGIALYDPERHAALAETYGSHDAGVCARWFKAWALALLGRHEDARRCSDDAVALARTLEHPFTLGLALFFASVVHQVGGDPAAVLEKAEAARAIARDQGLRLLLAWATALQGWALAAQDEAARGVEGIRESLVLMEATGSRQLQTYLLGLLAEAQLRAGSPAEARATVEEALDAARRSGERFHEPELRRLRAKLGPPA